MPVVVWVAVGAAIGITVALVVWFGVAFIVVVDEMERRFQHSQVGTVVDRLGPKSWVTEDRSSPVTELRPQRGPRLVVPELQPDGCEQIDPDSPA